jgi:hypothetical protein
MSNLLDEIIDVREKARILLDTADEAVSLSSNVKMVLRPAYEDPINTNTNRLRIVAVGRRSCKKYWLFGPRIEEVLFYYRRDHEARKYWTNNRGQLCFYNEYEASTLEPVSKPDLIKQLDRAGAWGKFLKTNENLLDLIHEACVTGFSRPDTKVRFY